jgi:hypothetical protein
MFSMGRSAIHSVQPVNPAAQKEAHQPVTV